MANFQLFVDGTGTRDWESGIDNTGIQELMVRNRSGSGIMLKTLSQPGHPFSFKEVIKLCSGQLTVLFRAWTEL